jgi:hypothetical protein
MYYECPLCKSENIQKSSLTHVSGISQTKGFGIGAGMSGGSLERIGLGFGVGKATNQTLLSKMTTPPKISSPIGPAIGVFLLIFLPCIVLCMFIIILADSIDNMNVRQFFLNGSFLMILLLIILSLSFWGAYKIYHKIDSKNNDIIAEYYNQYICLRCGNIFWLGQP